MKLAVLVVALGACGASAAEVKTAKDAAYEVPPPRLLRGAMEATKGAGYGIGDGSVTDCVFETQRRYYSPEGDLESAGAGNTYHFAPDSVGVSFVVRVVETDVKGSYAITVGVDAFQILEDSPKPRPFHDYSDPSLPSFVRGRADALALALHDRLAQIPPSDTKAWASHTLRCDGVLGGDDD